MHVCKIFNITVMSMQLEDSFIFIPVSLYTHMIKLFKHIVQIIPSFVLVLLAEIVNSCETI